VRFFAPMPTIIDAHCDLAWNMLSFGRDYTVSAADTRQNERGALAVEKNGDTLLGWPDYQKGEVAIVFATLFASPRRLRDGSWDKLCYSNADEAHRIYSQELDAYHRLAETKPDFFTLIVDGRGLDSHMAVWQDASRASKPVGLVILMEGGDAIRRFDELGEWHQQGVRLIGPSWAGTRYAGGTREPGPLTADGRMLLEAMAELGFVLDLSHMDETAASEALDLYEGPVAATHVNCLALLPDFPTNRHFPDRVLQRILERGGIVGNIPVNHFLKAGWGRRNGSRREEVPLDVFAAHIDHVCQLAGDSLHAGIGSDFDGGFGVQSVPPEIDTIADLQKVAPLLETRGYTQTDTANILGLNWLRLLKSSLPT
jgi:membrane dipeptidase